MEMGSGKFSNWKIKAKLVALSLLTPILGQPQFLICFLPFIRADWTKSEHYRANWNKILAFRLWKIDSGFPNISEPPLASYLSKSFLHCLSS